MNRRTFLAAAPAAGAAFAIPALSKAEEGDTPILQLFRKHQAIRDAAEKHVCTATGKNPDAEMEQLFYQHTDKIEAEMMVLPCTCAADFAAKLIVDTCGGGLFSEWETGAIWQEARSLTGSVA